VYTAPAGKLLLFFFSGLFQLGRDFFSPTESLFCNRTAAVSPRVRCGQKELPPEPERGVGGFVFFSLHVEIDLNVRVKEAFEVLCFELF
jgi:hypothetical protein